MTTLQTPAARAIIYFCCIGGLLVLNGLIVMVLWNEVFLDVADAERRLSFLEGAGLTAFAYVGVFSVRYAMQARRQASPPPERASQHAYAQQGSADELRARCSQMSAEDKAKLKAELIAKCGCADRTA
jgi:hypothetical protein